MLLSLQVLYTFQTPFSSPLPVVETENCLVLMDQQGQEESSG